MRSESQDGDLLFRRHREVIVFELESASAVMFGGEIEMDKSHFGGKRKGKRCRGLLESSSLRSV